jgi:hypothetical protein
VIGGKRKEEAGCGKHEKRRDDELEPPSDVVSHPPRSYVRNEATYKEDLDEERNGHRSTLFEFDTLGKEYKSPNEKNSAGKAFQCPEGQEHGQIGADGTRYRG